MRISDWSSDVCSSDLKLLWPPIPCLPLFRPSGRILTLSRPKSMLWSEASAASKASSQRCARHRQNSAGESPERNLTSRPAQLIRLHDKGSKTARPASKSRQLETHPALHQGGRTEEQQSEHPSHMRT